MTEKAPYKLRINRYYGVKRDRFYALNNGQTCKCRRNTANAENVIFFPQGVATVKMLSNW